MGEWDLKKRTKNFTIDIIKLVQLINRNGSEAAKIITNKQLLRSDTGIAANYRSACRCRSRKDFISKMAIVVEEADETQFWLELLKDSGLMEENSLRSLLIEVNELTAIMTSSRNSAIKNQSKL